MTANDLPLYDGPVADTETMEGLGRRLGRLLRAGDLVVLTGPLGAGKTTFTRGVGEGLQVRGQIASPTFVLARTHPRESGLPSLGSADGNERLPPLVHVAAYRLGSATELDDLDIDFAASIVVVEWGAGMLAADEFLQVDIERPHGGDPLVEAEPRHVTITGHGAKWERLDWLDAARD